MVLSGWKGYVMAKNTLGNARKAKQDEFYTQLSDIEREARRYKGQMQGKVIFCNCDDPYESNFFKYFAMNFNHLGLKKLIATCYIGSSIANSQLSLFDHEDADKKTTKSPHKIEITEVLDYDGNGSIGLADVEYLLRNKRNALTRLKGNGDFRSSECIDLLNQADIVVTNPPFSLFREYVEQLVTYNKGFLILGDQNAITYKEVFSLIRDNKIWLGYDNGGTKWFRVPSSYEIQTDTRIKVEGGIKYFSMGRILWYTNLDTMKRHESITLYKRYVPMDYIKYDNYDAINVDKVSDIPMDYRGVMGVPITFVDKYNPEQFEIIGLAAGNIRGLAGIESSTGKDGPYIGGKLKYGRILIRRKDEQ
jgi:hypothetical protein